MKINVTQGIRDYEGNLIMVPKRNVTGEPERDEDGKPILMAETLRLYLVTALNSEKPGEKLVAEDKAKIYMLSTKLYQSSSVDLTIHDRNFILDRVGASYGPLIYGRINDIFEGNDSNTGDEKAEDFSEPKTEREQEATSE